MGVNYISDKDIRNLIRTKYLYTVVLPLPGQVRKDSENVALHTAGIQLRASPLSTKIIRHLKGKEISKDTLQLNRT